MKVKCPRCGLEFEVKRKKPAFKERKRDPLDKVKRILNFLKSQDEWVWIRRIAKRTGIKPYAVSYILEKYLATYIEIVEPTDVYESTGVKMKLVRLKNREINVNSIVEDIKVRINS
ncbi:MAG: hypothetical protein J7K73_04055 [Nanoarchaeota archaeon]|nr:hypothetical protein [Nanoarchaeota archaeon]